jgi:3-oxoacyl-[acyl-carrier protein] reductase
MIAYWYHSGLHYLETNMSSSSERVALVTGGARGIGKACSIALAEAGFKVAIHYRGSADEAQAMASKLPHARAFQADLSDPTAIENLIKSVHKDMGSLDVLVNNAGINADQIIAFAKLDDFEKLVQTNLRSVFLTCKYVSKIMMKKKYGRIINMASVVGYTGNPGQAMYSATKGAITAFTKSIALELAHFGVTANCVAPGFITTDMTAAIPSEAKAQLLQKIPLKREGTPEEIAHTVAFLASDKSSYITGSTIHVNGGLFTN